MRLRPLHIQPRRALAVCVAMSLVMLGISPIAAHATEDEPVPPPVPPCAGIIAEWAPGTVVEITTADELYCIGENPDTLDLDYRLSNELDPSTGLDLSTLTGGTWRPIGLGVGEFTGSLDGNGKQITELFIDAAGAAGVADGDQYMGLFSKTLGATITNLTLTSPVVHAGAFSGSLVGEATRTTLTDITATNVRVTGDQTGEIKIGGAVGHAVNSRMTTVSVTGTVEADGSGLEVGGIIGRIDAGPTDGVTDAPGMTVADVDFSGIVRANVAAGGILGAADAPDTNETKWISITEASSAGTVSTIDSFDPATSWNNSIGGLIGYIYDSELSDLHSTAFVNASATQIGGLIGWAGNIRLTDASATGDVTNIVSGDDVWCDTGGLIGWLERAFVNTNQEIVPVSNVQASGNVSCEGGQSIGGLFGTMNGTDLSDASASGDVTGLGSAAHGVGGVAGYIYDTTLTDVSASGDVSTDGDYAGGLVAWGYRSNPRDSYVARDVVITRGQASGSIRGRSHVGGIVGDGEAWEDTGHLQIVSSVATGPVKGLQMVGGIAGGGTGDFLLRDVARTGTVTGWERADGTPPSADLGYYGGLVGFLSSTGSIERSYTTSLVTSEIEEFSGGGGIPAYDSDSPTVGSMIGVSQGTMTGLSFSATNPSTLRVAGQLPAGEDTKAVYRSLSQMGQLSTYESWNTPDNMVIVAGWVPSPRTTQVWGSCTDVASGLPFLQWQRTSACAAAPTPTPTPSPNSGGSGSGGTAPQPTTAPTTAPSTPESPSNGSFAPVVSTGSQPAFRQPTAAQPVTATVTLVPANVAGATPTRAMRQEASATLRSAPTVTVTANQPVKLTVPGFTPGGTYIVRVKSNNGYVVLGSVKADANGQLQMPVFRKSDGASTTTIAIVSTSGEASYVKVKTTKKRGAGERNRTRGAAASNRR